MFIGVNDDGYVVGVENSRKMLEILPNKINDRLGILASVQVHKAAGAENIRYDTNVPDSVSQKLVNQYVCGLLHVNDQNVCDKRMKSLSVIQNVNKIWEDANGVREYLSIEILKYPVAISCDGKYYKRSGSILHELNVFDQSRRVRKIHEAFAIWALRASRC